MLSRQELMVATLSLANSKRKGYLNILIKHLFL
jgi:hypothetical protein